MLTSKQTIGKEIENLVSAHLQRQGLQLIAANYCCKCGEIDLIMMDKETLVFVEVRYRQSLNYGDGIATVDKSKQERIKKAAIYYLQKHKLYDKVACRFDIVAVSGIAKDGLSWVRDAFWAKW